MSSYTDSTLREVLAAFSQPTPTPGGGAAAALAAATGVSLLAMAAALAQAREKPTSLDEVIPHLQSLRLALIAGIDRDAAAYSAVIAARRMPADTEVAADRRRRSLAEAMRTATDAPLDILKGSRQALGAAPLVATHCLRSTVADVGVAIELLRAAARGAAITVAANVPFIGDSQYVASVEAERRRLESGAEADANRAAVLIERAQRR